MMIGQEQTIVFLHKCTGELWLISKQEGTEGKELQQTKGKQKAKWNHVISSLTLGLFVS